MGYLLLDGIVITGRKIPACYFMEKPNIFIRKGIYIYEEVTLHQADRVRRLEERSNNKKKWKKVS